MSLKKWIKDKAIEMRLENIKYSETNGHLLIKKDLYMIGDSGIVKSKTKTSLDITL